MKNTYGAHRKTWISQRDPSNGKIKIRLIKKSKVSTINFPVVTDKVENKFDAIVLKS